MKKLTIIDFIAKAKIVHGNKYDYSKSIYELSNRKVLIGCKRHGYFLQTPNNHLSGQCCPKCNGNIKLTTKEFISRADRIHKGFYDYSHTKYSSTHSKVSIACNLHGMFFQDPSSHLRGFGCPKCACYRVSVPETEFLDFLKIVPKNRQVCIARKIVDGIDKNSHTIYEFLGDFWHGNPSKYDPEDVNKFCKKTFGELYAQTQLKFQKLKNVGYSVKYIWESDWKKFKTGNSTTLNLQTF